MVIATKYMILITPSITSINRSFLQFILVANYEEHLPNIYAFLTQMK